MTKYLTLLFTLSFYSCVNIQKLSLITGEYVKKGKGYSDVLQLKNDSTFKLEEHTFDVHKKCQGRWMYIGSNKILLKCDSEPFPAPLGTSYMQEREREVKVISRNKVRIDNTVLKKNKVQNIPGNYYKRYYKKGTYDQTVSAYCQNNDLYLKVQSLKEINGNFIIRATDVEKQYIDTLTLISFKDSIYINGQLKNRIEFGYGNLQKLTIGNDYVFKLFKPVIRIYSRIDSAEKTEYTNFFICVSGNDAIWDSYELKDAPYGIANGVADTIQYLNPILPIVDSIPKPIIINKETITKQIPNPPKSLREKADLCISIYDANNDSAQ